MARVTTLLLGSVLLMACSGDRWIRKPLLQDDDVMVYLEDYHQDDQIVEQQFAHPCIIDDKVLAIILKGLAYEQHKWFFAEPEAASVFFNKEIMRLAPVLADALAQANSNQRIRFVSFNMGGGLLFAARQQNEGVLFIKPKDKLNIAFSLINEELNPADSDYAPTSYRMRRDPLGIKSSNTPLQPREWYALHASEDEEKPHPMWAVVDISKPPAMAALQKALSKERAAFTGPAPATGAKEEPRAITGDVPAAKDPGSEGEKIRKNLEFLKELFEAGLISEKDYETKKKELLEGIQ